MMKRMIVMLVAGGLLSAVFTGPCCGQTGAGETSRIAGYRCLFIGHSFFVPVAKRFLQMPAAAGIKGHEQQVVFSGGATGSPGRLWQAQPKRAAIQKILDTGQVELLGMTCFDASNSSLVDYKRWIDYALTRNPKTRFFIGLPWGTRGATRPLAEYTTANLGADAAMQMLVATLRTEYPASHFHYCNYGRASVALKRRYEAGSLAGIAQLVGKQGTTVYSDAFGHGADILKDLAALLWLDALYAVDPASCTARLEYAVDLKQMAAELSAAK